MKIVIHTQFGGFSVPKAFAEQHNLSVEELWFFPRTNPDLIKYLEAHPELEQYAIVEIPDNISWVICEYDGKEWIAEDHRIWNKDGQSFMAHEVHYHE